MGAAATRRARLYSWQRVAAATLRVYEEVAAESALTQAVSQ
jgi:glycosyltransferase involved in cell wall biosynthesis